MSETITYYDVNKKYVSETELNEISIHDFHGMKVRCTMADGSVRVGYANTHYSFEKEKTTFQHFDYIALEILTNLEKLPYDFDIEYEKVMIADIKHIDAILYSGLRWGGVPTNKFWGDEED